MPAKRIHNNKHDFDKVWLMFQETDKQYKETDKKFQETDKMLNNLEIFKKAFPNNVSIHLAPAFTFHNNN